jgi:cytoskeletal protein RodZ
LAARTAITAAEAEGIIQRVEKINRETEVREKVERLERQNRKITILGSMFMTVILLALTAFAALMVQAKLLNPGAILRAFHQGESPEPASQKARAKEEDPQTAQPVAKITDPQPAKTVAPVSDPKPAQAKEVPHVRYVGSITSNKYHHPSCKWAAQIKPEKVVTFSSVTEARKRGYIPCPTCGPPSRDP